MEALACRITQNNEIKGFKYGTLAVQAVKICQYADDTILFLKNKAQIPIVLKELDNFRKLAGLVLNKKKTNAMFLGRDNKTNCDLGEINITRLGQLGANISPDRSSLTPQVLIGNFLKHNYPLLYELQHINLLCLYLPKEDGVSPDAEYITQIIFSIFLQ